VTSAISSKSLKAFREDCQRSLRQLQVENNITVVESACSDALSSNSGANDSTILVDGEGEHPELEDMVGFGLKDVNQLDSY